MGSDEGSGARSSRTFIRLLGIPWLGAAKLRFPHAAPLVCILRVQISPVHKDTGPLDEGPTLLQ